MKQDRNITTRWCDGDKSISFHLTQTSIAFNLTNKPQLTFFYTNFCTLVSRIDPQKIFPRTFVDRMIILNTLFPPIYERVNEKKPNLIDETSCQKFVGAKYI